MGLNKISWKDWDKQFQESERYKELIGTHKCADCGIEVNASYANESDKLTKGCVPAYCSRCASLKGFHGERAKQYMLDNLKAR